MCPLGSAGSLTTVADLTFAKSAWIHSLLSLKGNNKPDIFPLSPLQLQLLLLPFPAGGRYPRDRRKHCSVSRNVKEPRRTVSQQPGRCNRSKAAAFNCAQVGLWYGCVWVCVCVCFEGETPPSDIAVCLLNNVGKERSPRTDFPFVPDLCLCFSVPPLWKKYDRNYDWHFHMNTCQLMQHNSD